MHGQQTVKKKTVLKDVARFEAFTKGKTTTDVSTFRNNYNFRIKQSKKKSIWP